MQSKQIEECKEQTKILFKVVRDDAKIPLASGQSYKSLIKTIRHLFNEYRGERLYITGTVIGLLKGDK